MLTREEALVDYDDANGRVYPDRLSRKRDRAYVGYAERMLDVYAQGIGRTRRELHQQVANLFAHVDECPQRRIAAFQKLLDEASEYATDASKKAAKLRHRVFSMAAEFHPLVSRVEGICGHPELEIKQRIATELKTTWEDIDRELFADVIEFQRLRHFSGYDSPESLLARYNVAQTQAALYRAEQLVVWAKTDFKVVLRYAKLARLMHSIRQQPDGSYTFRFDGPASVLRGSTRYGVAMARFLPGLLTCRQWRGVAKVLDRRGKPYRLELSGDDGLHSQVVAGELFDSSWEAEFVAAWEASDCQGWRLERETEILHAGQTVFTPDFRLIAPDGRRVLLEIVGYWTPEYLQHKSQQLEKFAAHNLLLAVPEQSQFEPPLGSVPPIVFKRQLKPADVLARLDGLKPTDSPTER
jgi:predicted nuclease of restriction endonuclease-like RecB superfamily